jgi:hypothetical protein
MVESVQLGRKAMRDKRTRARIFFFIIGMLLLIPSYFMTAPGKHGEFLTSTLQNVGLIALTVVIVDFLWGLVGGDPVSDSIVQLQHTLAELRTSVRLLDDSHRTGLQRIFAASGAAGSAQDWMDRLKAASNLVDLMGYSLHVWTKGEHFESTVARLARNGVRIRVLIMAPDNPELAAFVNYRQIAGITLHNVVEEIKAALQAFQAIGASQ